mgnify:CR=1 FL=1
MIEKMDLRRDHLEAGEELAKGLIVSLERRDITGLARTVGMAAVRGRRRIRDVPTLRIDGLMIAGD